MCGIIAILGERILVDQQLDKLKLLVSKRGPDYCSPICNHETKCKLKLQFQASVLHLRGWEMQKQPVIDDEGNALLFNGQIYKFSGAPLDEHLSDTTFLACKLSLCKSKQEIAKVFASIDGPFAFIYWHESLDALFYGRDIFGRKSLCLLRDTSSPYPKAISSVGSRDSISDRSTWTEVTCEGIHCLDFSSIDAPAQTIFLWNLEQVYHRTLKCEEIPIKNGVETVFIQTTNHLSPLNLDSRKSNEFSEEERVKAIDGLADRLLQAVKMRLTHNRNTCLLCRKESVRDIKSDSRQCTHSKVAVAFSGGIDSTMIALALDKVFDDGETIDLVTVAFKSESPDRISVGEAFKELRNLCPRRNWRLVLGDIDKSAVQLDRYDWICHLILPCNTVLDDSLGCGCWYISRAIGRSLDSKICDTIFETVFEDFLKYDTSNSKRDYAIGCAEIFDSYRSPATIFYAGMGIDEQLGGYSSHRAAWKASGAPGVCDEISFQMRRISYRNLGRDDRTCSHHGRDVKLPYLDFDLISYLNQLPVGLKMNLDEPLDIGPKQLLRELSRRWGLKGTSNRIKRALQFGTKIANLESAKEKGNEVCHRLAQSVDPRRE